MLPERRQIHVVERALCRFDSIAFKFFVRFTQTPMRQQGSVEVIDILSAQDDLDALRLHRWC
jgi:hypothetical protein